MDRFSGALGEHKAKEHYLRRGYEIYSPEIGRSTCDFIAVKDGEVLRVEVKSTRNESPSGNYVVKLDHSYSNYTQRTVRTKFDSTKSDRLVCYVEPTERIHIFNSVDYEGRSTVTVAP